jgi:hypothetical protein
MGEEQQESECETCEMDRYDLQAHANHMVIDRTEVLRILNENRHQAEQITELQKALTLKEEHLRAHRRTPLTAEQQAGLAADLETTTRRVQLSYNQQVTEKS